MNAADPRDRPPRTGLLRERGFRLYWSAHSISLVGDEITILAIPLAAVLLLDAGAAEMGWLTAVALLPSLLLSIPGGAWADRQASRRRAMIVSDIGRFAAVASVPLAYAFDALTMTHLYVTEFVVGAFTVLFRVCNHHVYASVLAADRYVDGSALLSGSRSAAAIAGPGAGGGLVQALTAPFALVLDAVTYLVSAVCLGRIEATEAPPARRERGGPAAGLRWVAANRTPRLLISGVAMLSLFATFLATLFVLYATDELGLSPGLLGLVFAMVGLGGLAGAYLAPRVVRRIGQGPAIVAGFVGFSLPLTLVPLAEGPKPLVVTVLAVAQFGSGCGVAVMDIAANSYLIAVIPATLRSRVMGVVQTSNFGVRPVGAVLAGTLGAAVGLRPTMWIGTVGAVLSVLWVLPSGLRHVRTLPAPDAPEPGATADTAEPGAPVPDTPEKAAAD
ncbi:MFS transporter [Streptomyces sp. 184]|uniref:MFS transporter n=1 Tax=Streptomyces sp. 184 TaxID=1827526 RepID=UPI003892BD1D